ncbi:hypothetical protein SAMN04487910_2130 [Aquimarina amphilecti]|uniref:Uncharacterized protein n=1 Tax=Aquimarina amphilecti TaxID=1038014 RepID=A0A1H7NL18_AQUAM|nr:hypothetical protein [Aquimarina amphilecti]SEL24084.1 hypothetical protein SAMN04487910_2130 [Aquimarina amphilecti]
MKTKLLIAILGLSIISCSSSKKTMEETDPTVSTQKIADKKSSITNSKTKEINHKINSIIQNYLGVPISSIARSDIKETNEGYQWKFMNVKTGENFIANTDFNFKSVKIKKNKRS